MRFVTRICVAGAVVVATGCGTTVSGAGGGAGAGSAAGGLSVPASTRGDRWR